MAEPTPLAEMRGVWREFGGIVALRDIDLAVAAGEIVALIGPNGAGKTTLLNILSGVLGPTRGEVRFRGTSIVGSAPHRAARAGLTRTFQQLQLFTSLSALENVLVACEARSSARVDPSEAMGYLDTVGLHGQGHAHADTLAFGQRRLVEMGRALAARPALLLLDEPAAGLSGAERRALSELLIRIRAQGVTVLIVEHDLELALSVADRVVVLDQGVKIADLPPDAVRDDPGVVSAYLGTP
ncbi:MAG TPA: ATP-binding cassette domain-containing protein [Candidatus Limnocylindria bacterium]